MLTFEYVLDKEPGKVKKVSQSQKEKVVTDIASRFDDWDAVREGQKTTYNMLKPEIYLQERPKEKYYCHLNTINSLFKTEQAFLWDNIFSDFSKSFNVEGMDEESALMQEAQKKALDNAFYRMKVTAQFDKAVEYFSCPGEMCFFVSWKKKYKQIRRPLSFAEIMGQGRIVELLRGTAVWGIFEEKVYDGAYVSAVNPINFVFDPSCDPDIAEEFDAAGKILKHWETPYSLEKNAAYHLSGEEIAELKEMTSGKPVDEEKDDAEVLSDAVRDNKVEVLEFWGNYVLDGEELKNWRIVVVARRFLAFFGPNEWVINPFVNVATLRDPESKRGIPDLWSIYDLCKDEEQKVFLQNLAQALSLNPPVYAPSGFFKGGNVDLTPGKVVEFKQGQFDPSYIVKMSFPLIGNEQSISFLENKISSVSGIYPNMQGQQDDESKTATEIKVKVAGQTTRLAKKVDTIKQNAIVPLVQKVADLSANMKTGVEDIFLTNPEKGVLGEVLKVDDAVRGGRYDYKYTDDNSLQKKLAQNESIMKIMTPVWNDPALSLNKKQIVETALHNEGIEDTDKFFNEMPAGVENFKKPAGALESGGGNMPVPGMGWAPGAGFLSMMEEQAAGLPGQETIEPVM